ncbi:hypothetical protein ACMD2_21204 [Ananas comosus]|uniref:Uncharacterized protein n=1 Tax=Ananas comosus TaxID=4615 RepID=A0A199UUR8_ANACO|nr:hypothetical protein ACMD2_21204 [Ananas comosus]
MDMHISVSPFVLTSHLYLLSCKINPFFRHQGRQSRRLARNGGWIEPSLFDGIPNKDFLDGTQLQFKSVTNKVLSARARRHHHRREPVECFRLETFSFYPALLFNSYSSMYYKYMYTNSSCGE